jgi:uncharacterized protein
MERRTPKPSPKKRIARRPRKTVSKAKKKTVKKTPKRILRRPRVKPPVFQAAATVAPASPAQNEWEDRRLPERYDEDRLVLLTRDPWWLFAYWEVTPGRYQHVLREAARHGASRHATVLRVYDVTGGLEPPRCHSFFDIELSFFANNWYIDVGMPGKEWVCEVGLRGENGRFFALVRSNRTQTPAFGLSDVIDEEWMLPEDVYYRLIGRSLERSGVSGNSLDIRKLLEKYLRNVVSSENSPEISRKAT